MVIGHQKNPSGFTLIEILLVLGIFAIISSFTVINVIKPQVSSSLNSVATTLVSDLKEQQIKAMVGDSEGTSTPHVYGVRFEPNRYILFRGSYSPSEPSNFVVDLDSSLTFSTLPSGNQIVFARRNGETTAANFTLEHTQTGDQTNISINALGAVAIN